MAFVHSSERWTAICSQQEERRGRERREGERRGGRREGGGVRREGRKGAMFSTPRIAH